MTRRTEFSVFIDPAEKHPVGSAEWAGRISSRSMHEFERVESDVQRLVKTLQAAVSGRPWRAWPPDKPWNDCEAWSEALFGLPFGRVLNLIEAVDPEGAQELHRAVAGEAP